MHSTPKVSVLIPVFNAENYLSQTLDSIVDQTYKNLEIIIVNDGSNDSSEKIIWAYCRKYPIISSFEQENKGQCAASNLAISKASGDYIKFVDADDLINRECIQLQVQRLNGSKDSLASSEWGRFYGANANDAKFIPEPVWKDLTPLEWLKISLDQSADMMGAPLWLIPKELLDIAGTWNEALSLNNDFEFIVRLLSHAKMVRFTPGAKVYYRSGLENSLANSFSKKAYHAAVLSTELGCKHLLQMEDSKETRRLCANRYMQWLYRIYPNYKDLIINIEERIREYGGGDLKIQGGKYFHLLQTLVGWKMARRIQLASYKLGYVPKNPHS